MRRVLHLGGGTARRLCVTLGMAGVAWASALADEGAEPDRGAQPPHFELWSGAQGYRHVWAVYSGLSVAPLGSIQQDGLRLRVSGGYGADTYQGPPAAGGGTGTITYSGATSFADALIGYHSQLGPLTLKLFAGVAAADRQISPDDPAASIQGLAVGGKVAVETWWNLSERTWTAVDLSWASLYHTYAARGRLGWRIVPELSVGLDAGAVGNVDGDILRVAGFVRYELESGEISLSAGVSNDKVLDGRIDTITLGAGSPFAMVSWLTRF